MYGIPPEYHTRRSYVTLCEAFCGRPRQTLLASAWAAALARAPAVVFFGKAGSGVFQYWQWGFLADTDTDTLILIL